MEGIVGTAKVDPSTKPSIRRARVRFSRYRRAMLVPPDPTARLPLAASIAASSCAFLLLLGACGGAAPPAAAPSAPTAAGSPADTSAAAAAASPASSAAVSTAPTTTTATLADGGDLQGSKLKESSQASAAGAAGDTGPARGPHQQEPGRSVKDIQTIVQAHRDDARACYDAAQSQHPDPTMKGNLDVKWTIDPTGKVSEVSVDDGKSDIHDAGVAKCVTDVIRGIAFSVSAKGFETRAHYPFNFNPKNVKGPGAPPPGGH
jgi:hypothetical protein